MSFPDFKLDRQEKPGVEEARANSLYARSDQVLATTVEFQRSSRDTMTRRSATKTISTVVAIWTDATRHQKPMIKSIRRVSCSATLAKACDAKFLFIFRTSQRQHPQLPDMTTQKLLWTKICLSLWPAMSPGPERNLGRAKKPKLKIFQITTTLTWRG